LGFGPSGSSDSGSVARGRGTGRWGLNQAMSFSALSGRILTTFRAGLALKTVSSLVKGLMPLRALVAGFLVTLIFIRPGTVKRPGPRAPTFFLICLLSESKTA